MVPLLALHWFLFELWAGDQWDENSWFWWYSWCGIWETSGNSWRKRESWELVAVIINSSFRWDFHLANHFWPEAEMEWGGQDTLPTTAGWATLITFPWYILPHFLSMVEILKKKRPCQEFWACGFSAAEHFIICRFKLSSWMLFASLLGWWRFFGYR